MLSSAHQSGCPETFPTGLCAAVPVGGKQSEVLGGVAGCGYLGGFSEPALFSQRRRRSVCTTHTLCVSQWDALSNRISALLTLSHVRKEILVIWS